MDQPAVLKGVVRRSISHPETGEVRHYYLGTVGSDLIRDLTFVPVVEASKKAGFLVERPEAGYQRSGSATRMRLFAKFLRENPMSVVPPVVLSGRGKWKFETQDATDFGKLIIEDAAAIIDGQHRVGGYVSLFDEGRKTSVDFVLLPDLQPEEEVNEFLSINNTQKGVPAALNAFLKAEFDTYLGPNPDAEAAWDVPYLAYTPALAAEKALKRAGMTIGEIDLFEINEAFASVAIISTRRLGVDPARVNVNGGAVALGHPIGASGARIVLSLALELRRRGGGFGLAAICSGGGQGDAIIIHVENPA